MTKTRETMIAELGRRHPAAADDVDAILAMPRSDAVNEGLLADKLTERSPSWTPMIGHFVHVTLNERDQIVTALRAVPSPDTVGVREACDWPDVPFTFLDEPGAHDPCYVVMPGGAMLSLNHHAGEGVDISRAQFIVTACNAALSRGVPFSPAQIQVIVTEAMLDTWNDICADTDCHPLDIKQLGKRRLEFHVGHWARQTGARVAAALSPSHCTAGRRGDGTEARIAVLEKAVRSIANNTCCDNCKEAALVARSALASYIGLARTSEQSGPTTGREEIAEIIRSHSANYGNHWHLFAADAIIALYQGMKK